MSNNKRPLRKCCMVPQCGNTNNNAPNKLFISVPSDPEIRQVWQEAMGREIFVAAKSHVHCCEDHFNLEEDLVNYMYIKTMKGGNCKLKPNVVPRFFECQKGGPATQRPSKRRVQKTSKGTDQSVIDNNLLVPEVIISEPELNQKDVGTQVKFKMQVRNKGVQCTNMRQKRKFSFKEEFLKQMFVENDLMQ